MKNIKTSAICLIIGLMLGMGVFAVEYVIKPNPYPIVINGQQQDIQALNIDGFTYMKLADTAKVLNNTVKFNEVTKQIEISTNVEGVINMAGTTIQQITQTPDGITQIDVWEGKQYIGAIYIRNKVKEKGYDFVQDIHTRTWKIVKGVFNYSTHPLTWHGDEVVLDDVPITEIFGNSAVEVNYYINTILPLIK